jgi:polar amino acid transport system substrate-binding protein
MSDNAPPQKAATSRQLNLWLFFTLLVACVIPAHATESGYSAFPGFRHVDPDAFETTAQPTTTVTLQADADFAPWSFQAEDGILRGIAVDLATQACAEAQLTCSFQASTFADLLPALRAGQVQGLVSGPKLDEATASEFALTRPFFHTLGRFVVRAGSSLPAPDIRSLAGRRVGFRANTQHARFLETYYNRSALTAFDDTNAMLEALRTGQIDTAFGDAVQLSFWLKGATSRGCCSFLGKAFVDRETFSRSMVFVLRRDVPALRAKLDAALDRLEATGATAEILARYLPASVW